jgi:DNA-binding XRE family transcriptional regulator
MTGGSRAARRRRRYGPTRARKFLVESTTARDGDQVGVRSHLAVKLMKCSLPRSLAVLGLMRRRRPKTLLERHLHLELRLRGWRIQNSQGSERKSRRREGGFHAYRDKQPAPISLCIYIETIVCGRVASIIASRCRVKKSRLSTAFAMVIRRNRLARGLSQEALAEAAGIHHTYVGLLERGKRNATIEIAARLARALGKRLSILIEESEREAH